MIGNVVTPQNYYLSIACFSSCTESIQKINLKKHNLKFLQIEGDEFKRYLRSFNKNATDKNYEPFRSFLDDTTIVFPHRAYALVPINPTINVDRTIYNKLEHLLLIMFPSDLKLQAIMGFLKDRNDNINWSGSVSHLYYFNPTKYDDDKFQFDERKARTVNKFINQYLNAVADMGDFNRTVEAYYSSFNQTSVEMAFICLCISLESLLTPTSEIAYQISRSCAVINSSSVSEGEIIFKNAKQFYGLRSKIVHGDNVNSKRLIEQFEKLEALVSNTIVQILCHGIKSRKELNEIVAKTGYGNATKLSKSKKRWRFNSRVEKLLIAPI